MIASTKNDTTSLALTVYENNFGVVKEKLNLSLDSKTTEVQFLDVAEKIETDSILVKGLKVLEQNYDYDLVSKEKLLEKYVDKTVLLKNKKTAETRSCRLLSVKKGLVLEDTETKEILLDPTDELVLPKLPGELMVKPSLIWKVQPETTTEISSSYLTGGLSWTANYVMNVQQDKGELTGYFAITNHSGTTYENAKLKIIAGEVKRETARRVHEIEDTNNYESLVVYNHMESFEEESFADYHLYTLERQTTLRDNQTKQVSFLTRSDIPLTKEYLYSMNMDTPEIWITFKNDEKSQLGLPLPKGTFKVYEQSSKGDMEFIGEEKIDHTPKNEKMSLHIGSAFDIKCSGCRIDRYEDKEGIEYITYEYEIRNRKKDAVEVKVSHYIYESNWTMENADENYKKTSSNHLEFSVTAQPDEEKTFRFQYKVDRRIKVKTEK